MSEQYLEAHAFLKTLRDNGVPYTETLVNLMQYAVIEDVAPVVHAHWCVTDAYPHNVYCSKCLILFAQTHWEVWKDGSLPRSYCPSCGAKMDGGNNDS